MIKPRIRVLGDPELLAQVFANLVDNAITHSGPNASIELSLVVRGDQGIAAVSDNGPGNSEPRLDKVLRRFYRLDENRTTPGAGLGLSLVSAITELHGQHLLLSDNGPGLRIEIAFPLLRDDPRAELKSGTSKKVRA